MKATFQSIGPTEAARLLEQNINNRPLNEKRVNQYASDMKLGRWVSNGESIILNGHRVLDGQHRLRAVVRAGIPVQFLVVEGVPDTAFGTIDSGASRSGSNVLGAHKVPSANVVASALQYLARYDMGRMADRITVISNGDIFAYFQRQTGIIDSIHLCASKNRRKGFIPTSVLAALHYIFCRNSKDAANAFVETLCGTERREGDDAIQLLRSRLFDNMVSKTKLRPEYIAALTIKAWNAFRSGTKLRSLKWSNMGDKPEVFPVAI